MHIPDYMLNGQICPVTAGISVLGVAAATFFAVRSKEKPSAPRFAAVTALIFAAQMMNFPVQNGTSGHLLGGVLAASVLGTPFGILALTLVVTIQSLFFSDGGVTVLGANILNMGIIGAGLSGLLFKLLSDKKETKSPRNLLLMGALSWFSVVAASFACGVELSIAGTVAFTKVVPAMFGVHALIGIGEALITVAAFLLISNKKARSSGWMNAGIPIFAAAITAMFLSPFASSFPDGLEKVAQKYQFLHEAAPAFTGIMPDYIIPFVQNGALSTGLAGLTGVGITLLAAFCLGKLIRSKEGSSVKVKAE